MKGQPDIKGKTAEELLVLINAYQQAINVNIISSITDTSGIILYANEKFCEVSGYSAAQLVGQNHRIVNSGYHPKEFFAEMWRTLKSGKVWTGEVKNKARDGSFYWVDTVILPVRNTEDTIIQYLSLRTLITEKKLAEQEKQEYATKLNEMLHMTSHRVRRPLTTCMGLLNLIDEGVANNPQEMKEMIKHMRDNAVELDEFTKDLTRLMNDLEKRYASVQGV